MKIQQICVLLIGYLVVVEGSQSVIQCYVCDDCDLVNDCLLQSCPVETEVTPTTPTPPMPPTWSPTYAPTHTTEATAPTQSSNTASTGTSTRSTTTVFSTTDEVIETTLIPETSDTAGTEATTTLETPTPTGIITESESEYTSETEDTSDSPTSTTNAIQSSTSGATETDEAPPSQDEPVLNLTRRSLEQYDSSISHHCYTIEVVENYKQKKKRGCVEVPENESACGVLRKQYGCSAKNCKVCSTDSCNCNGALKSSLLAVIIITFCSLLSK